MTDKEIADKERMKIEVIQSYVDSTGELTNTAAKRIDVILITLSSGSIFTNISFIKFILENEFSYDYKFILLSILLFGLTIISSMFAWYSSFFGHRRDNHYHRMLLLNKTFKKSNPVPIEEHSNVLINRVIGFFNYFSFALFLAGFYFTFQSLISFLY
jgi:hypothetical protein